MVIFNSYVNLPEGMFNWPYGMVMIASAEDVWCGQAVVEGHGVGDESQPSLWRGGPQRCLRSRRVVVELSSMVFVCFFSNPEVAENVWVNTVEVCLGRQLLMFRGIVTCHPTSREIRGGSMLSKLIHGSIGYSHRNPFVGTGCKL